MRTTRLFAALGVCALAACTDSQGKAGALTLVELSDEFASTECPNGGQRVDAGRDTNRNAALDDDEVTSSSFICSGAEGEDGKDVASSDGQSGRDGGLTVVNVTPEPPGSACEAGGQRIEIGPCAFAIIGKPSVAAPPAAVAPRRNLRREATVFCSLIFVSSLLD